MSFSFVIVSRPERKAECAQSSRSTSTSSLERSFIIHATFSPWGSMRASEDSRCAVSISVAREERAGTPLFSCFCFCLGRGSTGQSVGARARAHYSRRRWRRERVGGRPWARQAGPLHRREARGKLRCFWVPYQTELFWLGAAVVRAWSTG